MSKKLCFEYAEKIPTNVRLTEHAKAIYKTIGGGKFSRGLELTARKVGVYCQGHSNYDFAATVIDNQAMHSMTIDNAVSEWIGEGYSLPAMLIALGQMIGAGEITISGEGMHIKKAVKK